MKPRASLLLAAAAVTLAPPVTACEPDLPGGTRVESTQHVVRFRTLPVVIRVGEHFQVELAVCSKAAAAIASVGIDAHMPEHRHGMNYTPKVAQKGARYLASGFLFHMPGRWEYLIDITTHGARDRLTASVTLD